MPAVTVSKSGSSLWWLGEDSPLLGVIDVTQKHWDQDSAPLLEEDTLTSNLSVGALAKQPAAGQADRRTCDLTWCCITVTVTLHLRHDDSSFPLCLTVRHGCREGREDGGRREAGKGRQRLLVNHRPLHGAWQLQVAVLSIVNYSSNVFPSQEYGVPFMETSAKTGVNVELAFLAVAK